MTVHGTMSGMAVRTAATVLVCFAACEPGEPLERLYVDDLAFFDQSVEQPPAPAPPSPPVVRGIPAPPAIARLVRDRLGAPEVTLFKLSKRIEDGVHLGYAIDDATRLEPAETQRLVALLADDEALLDGLDGCTCSALGVRIARGSDHVDFIIDCGNVSVSATSPVGALSTELGMFMTRVLPWHHGSDELAPCL